MASTIDFMTDGTMDLIRRGGWVMWPLLAMSVVSIALALERAWFWWRINKLGREAWLHHLMQCLHRGDRAGASAMISTDRSVYSRVVGHLLSGPPTEAMATEAIEVQRPRLERFMPTLSTIITAAPMLGILGTVFGIISSFQVLSESATITDPRAVGRGIAEALLSTASGLVVAIVALFPYNGFRAQVDRTLGRLEVLVAAAQRQPDKEPHNRKNDEEEADTHAT